MFVFVVVWLDVFHETQMICDALYIDWRMVHLINLNCLQILRSRQHKATWTDLGIWGEMIMPHQETLSIGRKIVNLGI